MKKIIPAIVILFLSCLQGYSQKKDDLLIVPEKPAVLQVLEIKDCVVKIKKVPATITVQQPGSEIVSFTIEFKKDNKTIVTFSYGKTESKDAIALDDYLKEGNAELGFLNDMLVRINIKALAPKNAAADEIVIKKTENKPAEKKEEDIYARLKTDTAQKIIDLNDNKLQEIIDCLMCYQQFDECVKKGTKSLVDSDCKICGIDSAKICGLQNTISENNKRLNSKLKDNKENVSQVVKLEYDEKIGYAVWKVWNKKGEWKEINAEDVKIISGSDIRVEVTGDINTEYKGTIEGQNYFTDSSDMAGLLQNLENAVQGLSTATTNKSIDSIKTVKQKEPAFISTSNKIDLKAKFLALDKVLERFNYDFHSINFKEDIYIYRLALLKQAIKKCLGIPAPDNEKDFAAILINMAGDSTYIQYWTELSNLIKVIEAEYKKANTKTPTLRKFGFTLPVPNADEINLGLENISKNKSLYKKDFLVKGGFKIDFSTGVFFTGLGTPSFDLYKTTFSYRVTRDSIVVRNGLPVDTLINTNTFRDTAATFIRSDSRKLNFGAGFFAHGYWRSGCNVNIGVAAGLVYNSDGQIQVLLGISPMINVGKNRIALVGGVAFGKTSTLSSVHSQSQWKDEYAQFENGGKVFESKRLVPKFFESQNSSDIKKVESFKPSWFLGLTFNFASVVVGKK